MTGIITITFLVPLYGGLRIIGILVAVGRERVDC